MNRLNNKIQIAFLLLSFMSCLGLEAQTVENNFQTRTSAEFSFKPIKNFKLNFSPELRFDEEFTLDKFLFETQAVYKALDFLSVDASYRIGGNLRDNKGTEFLSRYAFSATASKEFFRFEPSVRLRFSNDADDDLLDEQFMRYKFGLDYNLRKSKFKPFVAVEAFQELTEGDLYKMRYTAGVDYKLFKNNYIGLDYKFDYYQKEYKNNHIISLGYKLKF